MPATAASHVPADCPAAGFSVAELLAAIVVLAVGILGVVALYVDRLHEQTRNPHMVATALAEEMAQRVRAHREEGAAKLEVAPFCIDPPAGARNVPTVANLAQEAACWQDAVARALPNGAGMVEHDDDIDGYRLTVSWSEAGAGAASVVVIVR